MSDMCSIRKLCIILIFVMITSTLFYSRVYLKIQVSSDWNFSKADFPNQPIEWEYVVNTSTCKIVNISLWRESVLPYLKPLEIPTDCRVGSTEWTYINGSKLIINETALKVSGFSQKNVRCCYKVIKRVEQSLKAYDDNADRVSSKSKECFPLKSLETKISEEFIRVQCISTAWPMLGDVLYRASHALALPHKNKETRRKIRYWEKRKEFLPPNVLFVGIDAMTSVNFGRTMVKTKRFLQDLGAQEFLGYTKCWCGGYNTYPNLMPLLTGYSANDVIRICMFSLNVSLDACPFIWKRFSTANYLTGHLEDAPILNMLNYEKRGLVKQQVDFYLRQFMITVYETQVKYNYHIDCIGPKTVDETMTEYIGSLQKGCDNLVPLFLFTWMTNLAHDDMNKPKFADETYQNFLQQLNLNNTILIFLGDHGIHIGEFQTTFMGWYEERNPNFWIYLPPHIQKRYPQWMRSLEINARRLTSPFDVYHTLNHILQEFSYVPPPKDNLNQDKFPVPRKHGQSMFKEIPENRLCADAGISEDFCLCSLPAIIQIEREDVRMAAKAAITNVNDIIPTQCAKFKLKRIISATSREEPGSLKHGNQFSDQTVYTIVFIVAPGDFIFEATLKYSEKKHIFDLQGQIVRVSKMTNDRSCIHDYYLERYCLCKS